MQVDSLPLIGIHSFCTSSESWAGGAWNENICAMEYAVHCLYWQARKEEKERKAKQDQQLELERCSNIYANFGAGICSVLSRGKYNDYKMKLFAATPRDIQ